jgi:hypothetical protein
MSPVRYEVMRRLPTFDFILHTSLSEVEVLRRLSSAMADPRRKSFWPLPNPQLSGSVRGPSFSCRPRTSALGGNAVPYVSGQVHPTLHGATEVHVRVVDWFAFLLSIPLAAGALYTSFGLGRTSGFSGLAMATWLLVLAVGLHLLEARFVKNILVRILESREPAV